uniref:Uncharacterized protein n=1 Tax=Tanacetum cinerariifolium TaxID=118510 RepID=A0A6L2NZX3_TANCI|nr:hypothetical protein [Tanacetum cinerariifolium]
MIDNIDQDVKIIVVDDTQGRMNKKDMFGVNDLSGDEVVVDVSASEKVEQSIKVIEKEVSTADPVTTAGEVVTTTDTEVTTAATTLQKFKDELTLAHTLIEIKAAKPKAITTAATIVTAAGIRPKEKKGLCYPHNILVGGCLVCNGFDHSCFVILIMSLLSLDFEFLRSLSRIISLT